MANFSIKIDLLKLRGAFMHNIQGSTAVKRCICIPVDEPNGIFVGEKGVYLNVTAVEMQQERYGDSHCLKENLDKDAYYALSEEERRQLPIIGGLRTIVSKYQQQQPQQQYQQPTQAYQAPVPPTPVSTAAAAAQQDEGDLPF